jgi:hypothetical protein
MKTLLKILLISFITLILFIGGFYLFLHIAFDGIFTGPTYDKEDLIENYELRKNSILDVKAYINSNIKPNTYVDIEFENGNLAIFHVKSNGNYDTNWDLKINSKKTDSILSVIGWKKNDLEILEKKLSNANCISIANGNPTIVGWQRSGMGKYYYNIYEENLSDSLINILKNNCSHIFYKENIVLEYGGGAIGSDCFPGFVREKAAANNGYK